MAEKKRLSEAAPQRHNARHATPGADVEGQREIFFEGGAGRENMRGLEDTVIEFFYGLPSVLTSIVLGGQKLVRSNTSVGHSTIFLHKR